MILAGEKCSVDRLITTFCSSSPRWLAKLNSLKLGPRSDSWGGHGLSPTQPGLADFALGPAQHAQLHQDWWGREGIAVEAHHSRWRCCAPRWSHTILYALKERVAFGCDQLPNLMRNSPNLTTKSFILLRKSPNFTKKTPQIPVLRDQVLTVLTLGDARPEWHQQSSVPHPEIGQGKARDFGGRTSAGLAYRALGLPRTPSAISRHLATPENNMGCSELIVINEEPAEAIKGLAKKKEEEKSSGLNRSKGPLVWSNSCPYNWNQEKKMWWADSSAKFLETRKFSAMSYIKRRDMS